MDKRRGKKALDWAIQIKTRDDYKCKNCGCKNFLDAHHIIPWRLNESLRFDLSNGITLCRSCHTKIDGFKINHCHSEEIRKKISESKKGQIPWIKGKKHTKKTRLKMSKAKRGKDPWNKGMKEEIPERKICKDCMIEKEIFEFTPEQGGRYRNSRCRLCRNKMLKEIRQQVA